MGVAFCSDKIPDEDTYEGPTRRGVPHGQGVYTYNGEYTYEGTFYKGKPNGQGKLTILNTKNAKLIGLKSISGNFQKGFPNGKCSIEYTNKDSYTGDVKDFVPHGQGRYQYQSGDVYTGEFSQGAKTGFGTFYYMTGMKYTGHWRSGKRHGSGVCLYQDDYQGRVRYEGSWVDDVEQGVGKCVYHGGCVYNGEWFQGKYNGDGELLYENGNKYRGRFLANKRIEGTIEYANGDKYCGGFKDEKRHGYGVFTTLKGRFREYSGNWNDGIPEGSGSYIFANGEKFTGEVSNGDFQKGKYVYKDNSVYDGEWLHGKRHGKGRYISASGNEYTGEWEFDVQHGKGHIIYKEDGEGNVLEVPEEYYGTWVNGNVVSAGDTNLRLAALRIGEFRVKRAEIEAEEMIRLIKEEAKGNKDLCVVCRDELINTLFLECCHFVCCAHCAIDVKKCVKCAARINRVVRVYRT